MKSYVGMGHDSCPICGVEHNEVVLINKRLRDTLERRQVVGISICPECTAKINDDYVALVSIDESKSNAPYTPMSAYRTGNVLWIKRDAWGKVFSEPAPRAFGYCDDDVIEMLAGFSEAK